MNYTSILIALRTRSLRRGIWFRVLNRLERAQVDLTVRVVRTVRSPVLRNVLDLIVRKLSTALENKVVSRIKSVGFLLASKLSEIAQRWGNMLAEMWVRDVKFARFLAVMDLNSNDQRF